VIDIDGLDARFLDNPTLRVKIPNLRKLARNGVVVTVNGVAPSDSWSAAVSLVTGTTPAVHGIRADGVSGVKSETLWEAAEKAGLKTALVDWPATSVMDAPFVFPGHAETRAARTVPFDDVASKSAPQGLADRIDQSLGGFVKEVWDDESSVQAALYLLNTEKPDLLLVYLADANAEQHETLALSIYARDVLESDDDLIGQLMAKLPSDTVIAIVSGHGFEDENYVVRPKVLLRQAGVTGMVEVADGLIGTPSQAVAERLRKLAADGRKHGLGREVPMAEVRAKDPGLRHWVAAFDTALNTVASNEDRGLALGPGSHLGVNGLWPGRANYRALLILSGAGIKPRRLGEIDMLRIAPTLADVLGVKLPKAAQLSVWPLVTK
jgi:predicted AlkP superfamily pyrophosphatase or phosphodiesterase